MGRIGVDVYPLQTGVSLREVETLRQVPRRQLVQRRGRRRPLRPQGRDDHAHRRRPVRRVPARRAAGLRRRRPLGDAGRRPAHAGHVLRDLPARRLPAVLLPRAQGAGPRDPRRTSSTSTRSARRKVFWATVTGLSQEPSRSATLAALEARATGITVLDLDYRPMFWASREEARKWVARGAPARRPSPSATRTSGRPRSDRDPRGRGVRRSGSTRRGQAGPARRARRTRRRGRRGAARAGRGRQRPRRRRRVRRRALPRAAGGVGPRAHDALLQRRRARSSPAAWPAPTRCPTEDEVEAKLEEAVNA